MVYRLLSTAGSFLALVLLQATIASTSLAQQAGARPNAYLRSSSNTQEPRDFPRPSRNFGDVLSGSMKKSGVRTAANEEPIRASEHDVQPGEEIMKPSETIKPGIVAENDSVFDSEGEIYDGEPCGDCCDECAPYCSPACCSNYYVRGEYLLWWLGGDKYPPLVTTSPDNTPQDEAGVLGESGTRTLFGDDSLNGGSRNGVRTVFGAYLTECQRLEFDWFTLGGNGATFHRSSEGDPILARPFFNLEPQGGATPAQDANLIAYPGVFDGRIDIRANTEFMGAGVHGAVNLSYCDSCAGYRKLDVIYGFRYLGLYENFDVDTSSTVTGQSTAPIGTVFNVHDAFATSNNFFGANIGVVGEAKRGRWFLGGAARIGFGGTREHVSIGGTTIVSQPGEDPVTSTGGLLAQPTNIGKYSGKGFALVPHLELRVAYAVTRNIRWNVGYDLMYWSRVVRPGDQIDTFLNLTQATGGTLTGTPGPLFPFKETDLWITGVSTGFEFNF